MTQGRNWEIGTYRGEDKPGILALNRAEYGDVALSQEAYFDWLRAQNPAGEAIVLVAREKETGRPVGFCMFVPMRISWRGDERLATVGMNLLVAPAFRRQRIYCSLQDAGLKECQRRGSDFFYVFPNAKSLAGLAKWDFHIVCQVPLVVRPLDIAVLTETHIRSRLLQWVANLGWQFAAASIWRQCPSRNGTSLRISEDVELDEEYDRFWKQVKDKYDLMLIRDRTFLKWRFLDIPSRSYQVLSARQGTEIVGYIVLRQADIRGSSAGLIADLVVLDGERGTRAGLYLLGEVLGRFRRAQVPISGGIFLPHAQEYAIMRQAGHLRAPRRFAPQSFHLVVKNLSDGIPSSALVRPEGWYVSIADHDAV
jgi:predicted N-acetyltransferase YhbS